MWLFLPEGFFSVVTAEEFGAELQVRARAGGDLDALRATYLPSLGPTKTIPHHDYPFRAFTTRADWSACLVKAALAIDYDNFKNEVARVQGHERAHVYSEVWSACRKIEKERAPGSRRGPSSEKSLSPARGTPADRTEEYRQRNLHGDGTWPVAPHLRYGGVVFNPAGRILLREPANHYGGFTWTFPKGGPDKGEHPVDAALREVREETGCEPAVVGHLAEAFRGGIAGSTNLFFVMAAPSDELDESAVAENAETWQVRWATLEEARQLIAHSETAKGRKRDLATLEAAFGAWSALTGS